jgi:hypothetical protein
MTKIQMPETQGVAKINGFGGDSLLDFGATEEM